MPRLPKLEADGSFEMGKMPRHILPFRKADPEDDSSSKRNLVNDTELSRIAKTTRIEILGGDSSVYEESGI